MVETLGLRRNRFPYFAFLKDLGRNHFRHVALLQGIPLITVFNNRRSTVDSTRHLIVMNPFRFSRPFGLAANDALILSSAPMDLSSNV